MCATSHSLRSACLALFATACAAEVGGEFEDPYHDHFEGVEVGSSSQAASIAGDWSMPADVQAIAAKQRVGYDGFDGCIGDGKILPGVRTVTDYITRHFGGIKGISRIAYCRKIGGSTSSSVHGTGRAIDIYIPEHSGYKANNTAGDRIANWLAMNAEALGMQMIIWDRSLWKPSRGYMVGYSGVNAHVNHLHVEFTRAGASGRTAWHTSDGPSRSPFAPTGPPYAAELASAEGVPSNGFEVKGTAGTSQQVSFAFRNAGHKDWAPGEVKLALAPMTEDALANRIRNNSWPAPRVMHVLTSPIEAGKTAVVAASIKLPTNHTGLRLFVGLVRDHAGERSWLAGGAGQDPVYFDIPQPRAAGRFERLANTDPNQVVLEGIADDVHAVRFAFRNTGEDAWRPGNVQLVITPATAPGVSSAVQAPSWVSDSVIQELATQIAPTEVATFNFEAVMPPGSDGMRVFVGLRQDDSLWLAGGPGQSPIYFDIDQPSWAATFEEQESVEPNRVLLRGFAGEEHPLSFAFRNVGAETWQPEQIKLVLSGPTPEDVHGLATSTWLSGSEVATPSEPIKPGAIADLSFTIQVPENVDHAKLHLGLVHESQGVQTWLAGGAGHAPISFEVVRLDEVRAVLETREDQTIAFLQASDNAPSYEVGQVSFASEVSLYDHEGIQGGCRVVRNTPLSWCWSILLLCALGARRRL